MARKCHFASASTICGAEALAEAFRLTIYLKQNVIIFVKKLPDREFIFLQ
jgi:hypothetical protein